MMSRKLALTPVSFGSSGKKNFAMMFGYFHRSHPPKKYSMKKKRAIRGRMRVGSRIGSFCWAATTRGIMSIVAKSAMIAPRMRSWPYWERAIFISLTTGMTTPSDVVEMMRARKRGALRPMARVMVKAMMKVPRNAITPKMRGLAPRSPIMLKSISRRMRHGLS